MYFDSFNVRLFEKNLSMYIEYIVSKKPVVCEAKIMLLCTVGMKEHFFLLLLFSIFRVLDTKISREML